MKDSITNKEYQELRRRAQTDLYWLATAVLKKDLTEYTHRPVTDFFVQKNPDIPLSKQDTVKQRLLLYPRGSFKSTIDVVDCLQWIICFPNIRILILCGGLDLATSFVGELKEYFILAEDAEPTTFQTLFPEFCVTPKQKGNVDSFTVPNRTKKSKEPTVMANSIGSNLSGFHFDVFKSDDVITNENSKTPNQLAGITKDFYMNKKMLMPAGYLDVIGTRYDPSDLYGDLIDRHESALRNNLPSKLKILSRPAWWIKGTDYKIPTEEETAAKENIDLLFPAFTKADGEELGLSWEFLRLEQHQNGDTFASQYLNHPSGITEVCFVKEELISNTVPFTQFPQSGKVFIAWDLAYSIKKGRDYTVGAIGMVSDEAIWIVDIIRGRYQPHEMPYLVVKAIHDYKPLMTSIEETRGAKWMMTDLEKWAQQMQVPLAIDWITPDNAKDAKAGRVKALENLLSNGRLKFSTSIGCLEALYREFVTFDGEHRDDIPDAISQLQRYMNKANVVDQMENRRKQFSDLREKDLHDRIYGMGRYAPPEQAAFISPISIDPYTGLPN